MNVDKIRKDFPVLQRKISGRPVIYFDNACMSLKPVQVIEAVNEYYNEFSACAGRSIHKLSQEVEDRLEAARKTIQKFIGAKKSEEIVFTRNTTESINLVANSFGFEKNDVVVTTDREHNSNLLPWQLLVKNKGIIHRYVKSSPDGTFNIESFEDLVSKDAKFVSIVHTSNLDGYTLPVKDIVKISHDYGAVVMLDGAQAVPHKEVNVKKLGVDFYAFSGHKMLGPTGTGVLYGRYDLLEELSPFIVGGETVEYTTYETHVFLKSPHRFEAGLQDYAGIIGLCEAAKYLQKIGKENIEKHEIMLNRAITEGISEISGLKILGPRKPELRGSIISFILQGIDHHEIAMLLDSNANIMIRSGQHCVHSWFKARGIPGSARASLYLYNTREEAEKFIEELKKIAELR